MATLFFPLWFLVYYFFKQTVILMLPHSPFNVPSAVKILLKTTIVPWKANHSVKENIDLREENDPKSPSLEFSFFFSSPLSKVSMMHKKMHEYEPWGEELLRPVGWQFLRSLADHHLYIGFT